MLNSLQPEMLKWYLHASVILLRSYVLFLGQGKSNAGQIIKPPRLTKQIGTTALIRPKRKLSGEKVQNVAPEKHDQMDVDCTKVEEKVRIS